jgi:hypothetical protein
MLCPPCKTDCIGTGKAACNAQTPNTPAAHCQLLRVVLSLREARFECKRCQFDRGPPVENVPFGLAITFNMPCAVELHDHVLARKIIVFKGNCACRPPFEANRHRAPLAGWSMHWLQRKRRTA